MSERRHLTPLLLPALGLMLVLALVLTMSGPLPSSDAAPARLSNGGTVTARGIPSSGAYFGAAYGGNAPVSAWEQRRLGRRLGVHRTYWGGNGIASAIRTAKADAASPVAVAELQGPVLLGGNGLRRGDGWARGLARQIRGVRGPVWVAIHHEPENDGGNIEQWKAMQKRLAPIMRSTAPNLGYTIILMGYHQFYGAARYRMSNIWPDTKIDVAGFDIYEKYGVRGDRTFKNFYRKYFLPLQAWSRRTGVRWGIAETGYSHAAARKQPRWMRKVYTQMVNQGGIAFSYFNTNLNSKADWRLRIATKLNAFKGINRTAPRLR